MNGKKKLIALMKPHKKKYIQAIVLAILGVACGMIPYFAIASIMISLMNGNVDVQRYALLCGIVLLGFTLKIFFANWSTTVSHTATFLTLKEIRIKIVKCPKCGGKRLQITTETDTHVKTSGGGYSATKGCFGWFLWTV